MRNILNNLDLRIETDRLILEPINETHAIEMTALLAHPDLHVYVPSDPPMLEKLKSRYKYWESRISPQEDELWQGPMESLQSCAIQPFEMPFYPLFCHQH